MQLRFNIERAAKAIRALYTAAQKVSSLAAGSEPAKGEKSERSEKRALFGDEPTVLHIWADVTLHNAPVHAPFTPKTIVFPTPVQTPEQRICAFCRDDQLQALSARGEFDKCLSYRAMKTDYPSYAQRRALAKEFSIFCCESSCFLKLAQYGGKALVRSRRPICLPGSILKADRDLVSRCFTLCPISKPRCGVCVGFLTFGPSATIDEEELSGVLRNLEVLGPRLAAVVPAGPLNVKQVELRADMRFLRDIASAASAPAGGPLPSELNEALRIPKIPIYRSTLEPGVRLIDQAPLREVDPLDRALEELRAVAEEEGLYDGQSLHSSYQGSEADDAGDPGDVDAQDTSEDSGEADPAAPATQATPAASGETLSR